jgi:hypothetical protein
VRAVLGDGLLGALVVVLAVEADFVGGGGRGQGCGCEEDGGELYFNGGRE